MFSLSRSLLSSSVRQIRPEKLRRQRAAPLRLREMLDTAESASLSDLPGNHLRPMILNSLNDSVTLPQEGSSMTGQQLWNSTRLLREVPHIRRSHSAVVVGGAASIRRIWREYKIRPNVVYVPDTEPAPPAWCLEEEHPTMVVRCSPVDVNKKLLSAEYNDGFAAEFPLPCQPPLHLAVGSGSEEKSPTGTPTVLGSMLVLSGLRIPSNVGALVRAAVDMGYESVLLHDCVDVFHEKVLRASEGTVLSPNVKIFEYGDDGGSDARHLLHAIAKRNNMFPLFAVPSQEAEPAFDLARRLHRTNLRFQQEKDVVPKRPRIGPMLILGSEAKGLAGLFDGIDTDEEPLAHHFVSIPIPNAAIDSINVSVAGSILLHLFRPAAENSFRELDRINGERVDDNEDLLDGALGSQDTLLSP